MKIRNIIYVKKTKKKKKKKKREKEKKVNLHTHFLSQNNHLRNFFNYFLIYRTQCRRNTVISKIQNHIRFIEGISVLDLPNSALFNNHPITQNSFYIRIIILKIL